MSLKATGKAYYDHIFGERHVKARLLICLIIVVGFFLFSRLPFFLYYPLPIAAPDTATYLWQLEKIEQGDWPTFELRTPGYPLFWGLCRLVSDDILFVIYVQNAITLFSVSLSLILLARYSPQYLVPVTFTLAVFISSPTHLAMDMFLLTESLFVNAMILFSTLLYLVLHSQRAIFAWLASLMAAVAIYIRPNAAFLIIILAITLLYALYHKFGQKVVLGLAVPLSIALGGLVLYNIFTIKVVGLTAGQDWAMLWSTTIYLEPDPSLPDEINQAIEVKSSKISDAHTEIIHHSWDLVIFQQVIEHNIWDAIVPIAQVVNGPGIEPDSYLKERPLLKQISQTAIRQHPEIYLKNVLGAFLKYFMMVSTAVWGDFYTYWPAEQYRATFVERSFYIDNLKDYYNPSPPTEFKVIDSNGTKQVIANPHRLTQWYSEYTEVRAKIFENIYWVWPLLIGLVVSVIGLCRSKGSAIGSLYILLLIFCLVGHALISALSGHVEDRYSYTLEFVNYLLFALAPVAFNMNKTKQTGFQ